MADKLRELIRSIIEQELDKIDADDEFDKEDVKEVSSVTAMGGQDAYQTPYAFTGNSDKNKEMKKKKIKQATPGWEQMWDEEEADKLENLIVKRVFDRLSEINKSGNADFGNFAGKELFTGQDDFKKKNKWIDLVSEMIGFEVVGYGEEPDTFVVKGDPQTVRAKTVKLYEQFLNEGRRGAYHNYRDDDSATTRQKIGHSIKEIRDELRDIENRLDMNLRLKEETGIATDSYWKRTRTALNRLSEIMHRIQQKIRKF